jgi:hypothetical protein
MPASSTQLQLSSALLLGPDGKARSIAMLGLQRLLILNPALNRQLPGELAVIRPFVLRPWIKSPLVVASQ